MFLFETKEGQTLEESTRILQMERGDIKNPGDFLMKLIAIDRVLNGETSREEIVAWRKSISHRFQGAFSVLSEALGEDAALVLAAKELETAARRNGEPLLSFLHGMCTSISEPQGFGIMIEPESSASFQEETVAFLFGRDGNGGFALTFGELVPPIILDPFLVALESRAALVYALGTFEGVVKRCEGCKRPIAANQGDSRCEDCLRNLN